ncbi:MAG: DNA repair protein RecO [Spirochaetia bacterium]|jgi:DNA repair protein RecO|nr:DNA repair protein RecO [Spirochaetia bacterium]
MNRNLKIDGIVIRNYRIHDFHKGSVVFSPQRGIIHTISYGGYKGKSKLGPAVQPLTRGRFDIYQDHLGKSIKIIDYAPEELYDSLKSNLKKYFTALCWLEIAVKAHGGGEGCLELYHLLIESLDLLEKSHSEYDDRLMVQYLLRSTVLIGGNFISDECGSCSKKTKVNEVMFYNHYNNCFICSDCGGIKNSLLEIVPGIRKYIEYSLKNEIELSLKAGIENNLLKYLKSILYSIIQEYLEDSLSTLRTGKEYLL